MIGSTQWAVSLAFFERNPIFEPHLGKIILIAKNGYFLTFIRLIIVCYILALENQVLLEHCIIISQGQSSNTSKFFGLFHINGNINPAEILRNHMVNHKTSHPITRVFVNKPWWCIKNGAREPRQHLKILVQKRE